MRDITHIVGGVDSSDRGREALDWASAGAAVHGAQLTALTAWEIPTVPVTSKYLLPRWGYDVDVDPDRYAHRTLSMLGEVVAEAGVEADCKAVYGAPAKVLIDQSGAANLLVVGSRGHGGFAGMLIGSVSQHVAAHAKCPVVIVR